MRNITFYSILERIQDSITFSFYEDFMLIIALFFILLSIILGKLLWKKHKDVNLFSDLYEIEKKSNDCEDCRKELKKARETIKVNSIEKNKKDDTSKVLFKLNYFEVLNLRDRLTIKIIKLGKTEVYTLGGHEAPIILYKSELDKMIGRVKKFNDVLPLSLNRDKYEVYKDIIDNPNTILVRVTNEQKTMYPYVICANTVRQAVSFMSLNFSTEKKPLKFKGEIIPKTLYNKTHVQECIASASELKNKKD